MPALPPWLEAAHPADYAARGMQIGVSLAAQRAADAARQQQAADRATEFQQQMSAEQAAQQFKMQQAARQEQMMAQEQARADAELQLKTSAAADKSKAILNYQAALKGGMDPLQAILQFGPGMGGQASPEAAALRSQATAKLPAPAFVPANTETGEPAHYVESGPGGQKHIRPIQHTTAYIPDTMTTKSGQVIEGQRNTTTGEFKPFSTAVNQPEGKLTQIQRAQLREAERTISDLTSDRSMYADYLISGTAPKTPTLAKKFGEIKKKYDAAVAAREKLLNADEDSGTKTASGRVRVKSPDGKIGSIPTDQLEDALAHGYSEVQ